MAKNPEEINDEVYLGNPDKTSGTSGNKNGRQMNWFINFSYYYAEYCDRASVHGLKFLGERKRYLIERIWWLIFISISLYFCATLILETYRKWITAPVFVSFATSETHILKIPFPAITICPLIKSVKSKFNFTAALEWKSNYTEYDEEYDKHFQYMSLVCDRDDREDEDVCETVDDADFYQFLLDVSPDFNRIMYMSKWNREDYSHEVDSYFTPMLTSAGICYSLNILDPSETFTEIADIDYFQNTTFKPNPPSKWSIDTGYVDDTEFLAYPLRTIFPGPEGGFDFMLYTEADDLDYNCGDAIQGYKIMLHHPGQIPRSNQRYFWLPLDQDVSVAVKPSMMTTSPALRSYRPRDRRCYFMDEKTLKFFKIYNQQNCFLECMANHTLGSCGCVNFYMPRNHTTPICGPALKSCASAAIAEHMAQEATFQLKRLQRKARKFKSAGKYICDCLPACHSLKYDIEISQLDWNWREGNILKNEDYNSTNGHLSRLRVFFKELQFMSSERNELYGSRDFWANCGGILGLFTGFSFLSLIEMVYFATLRLVCNIKKYGKRNWSGADELV